MCSNICQLLVVAVCVLGGVMNEGGRKWAVLMCLSFVVGCQSFQKAQLPPSEFEPFKTLPVEQRIMNEVRVRWEIREDVVSHCAQTVGMGLEQSNMTPPQACAVWNKSRKECTIYTSAVTTHTVLGHELRHCFEGHFHR